MTIKDLRLSKGFTQKTLAEAIGLKQTSICMWEKGKSSPSINRVYRIAKILEVSEKEILECFTKTGNSNEK